MTEHLRTEVAIIGGGIVGGSAALFLRKRGIDVTLLETAVCGAKASGVNYGGVRRQGRAVDQLPLARRAHALWAELPALIGTDGEYVRAGHLKLARNEEDLALLEAYRAKTRGYGLNLEIIAGERFRQLYSWLGKGVIAGSLCPEDGHANPRLVSPAFGRAAARLGARVLENHRVTAVHHDGKEFVLRVGDALEIRARVLLNCAGAWGNEFARAFNEPVPEEAIHPLMMVTEPLPVFSDLSLGIQGGSIYARQVARGNVIIGGGRGISAGPDFAQPDFARPGRAAIPTLLAAVGRVMPALANAHVIRFWSGVEGNMPDHNPVLGPSGTTPGLFHAFGFSGAGFQIGPAVGEVLADLVTTGTSAIPIDTFGIARYATSTRTQVDQSHPAGTHEETT
ncbi:FAD-binding oxidoreductase [Pigmentiphaga aceris]|uniref:FAD-binding oxidoreductase n=1 Tax=Pigmentiphaga aceris TaxID=1940612 RepID=A0A5C0AVV4_9BURK|nr:FAD-binding oxidoreductase [Pigmentiphaga aceris]QEI06345.1 FAD-binding oxidoreductase [Pigmentiphaga aceris]